ncbi:MAG: hypothetical protein ABI461_24345 [Polyangiaceae bacterium]
MASEANSIFSAPVAAAHQKDGIVFFGGYVVARNAFALTRLDPGGLVAWTVDAITDVHWSTDTDIHVFASPDGGAYVIARGIRNKKFVREIVAVGADGKLRAPAEAMSGDACATSDGLASLREEKGHSHATLRAFSGGAPRDLFELRAEGEHEIVCGEHAVFAVTHDDAVTLERAGSPPALLLSEHDTSDNIEEFTAGDDFGVINVGGGSISVRDVSAKKLSAWRALVKLPEGGDVVSGDADATDIYALYTEDTRDNSCAGGGSPARLTAVHAPRSSGDAHIHVLATLACDSDDGPFFTGFSHKAGQPSKFIVAWPERRGPKSGEPPISALAYVVLSGDRVSEVKRVPIDADALVDAGCDDDACYAGALTRTVGTDGMVPGPARFVRYPQ